MDFSNFQPPEPCQKSPLELFKCVLCGHPIRAGVTTHTSLKTTVQRKGIVQQHLPHVRSVCNLQNPNKYFTIHFPHAQQWHVPFSWCRLRWLQDTPPLPLRCAAFYMRPSMFPDNLKTCSMWLRHKACIVKKQFESNENRLTFILDV